MISFEINLKILKREEKREAKKWLLLETLKSIDFLFKVKKGQKRAFFYYGQNVI